MKMSLNKLTGVLLVSAATPAIAIAQDVDDADDTIIVTANKRQQNVEDVTAAIDYFAADTLTESGVADLDDLTQVSSSFSINTGGGQSQAFIRGIGSTVNGAGAYTSVAFYIDGVYAPRPYGLGAGLGDLDNIESVQVLKGPQGTIYGRNATGGAVLIETRTPRPGDEFKGFAQANIGNFGVRIYSGGLSGGITDTLAGSVNFSINDSDGFIENLSGGRGLDDTDGFSVGGKLTWEPSDRFRAVFKGHRVEDLTNNIPTQQVGQFDDEGAIAAFGPVGLNNPQALYAATVLQLGGAFGVDVTDPAIVGGIIGAAAGLNFTPPEHGQTFSNNIPDQLQGIIPGGDKIGDVTSGGFYADTNLSLNLRYEFDTFDIVGIGSYNDHTNISSTDVFHADPATQPDLSLIDPTLGLISNLGVTFSATFPSEAYSGEVYAVSKGTDIEWIAGVYYFRESGNAVLSAGAFEFDALIADNAWDVESIAVYGEVTYPLTDALSITAGGRYTDETYEIDDFFMPGTPANVGNPSRNDGQFTYNAKLSYDTGDWLFYGGYSTGFKSGSLNANNPSAGSVAPEEIGAAEIGAKGSLFDGRARISLSGFYYDYDNLQLNILNPVNSATFLVDGVQAEVLGAEIGFDVDLTESTNFVFETTLLDHEFTSDGVIPATNTTPEIVDPINGNDLPITADVVVVAGLNQAIPVSNFGDLNFNANVRYNSGFFIDQANLFGSGGDEDDSFVTVNSSLNFVDRSGRFEASVYVNNLFDEEYFSGGNAAAGGLTQFARIGRPRHFGGTLKVNF